MKRNILMIAVIAAALAFVLAPTVARADSATWIDDMTAAIGYYKGSNSYGGNWEPYLGQMTVVEALFRGGDHHATHAAMNRLMDMLEARVGGIPARAADELYNYCNLVVPVAFHDAHRHIGRGAFEPERAPALDTWAAWDEFGNQWFRDGLGETEK
jgi:hypothetical protein